MHNPFMRTLVPALTQGKWVSSVKDLELKERLHQSQTANSQPQPHDVMAALRKAKDGKYHLPKDAGGKGA